MPIDEQIERAIKTAVTEAQQHPALANQLIAWVNALRQGNDDIADRDSVAMRVETLYRNVVVEEDDLA